MPNPTDKINDWIHDHPEQAAITFMAILLGLCVLACLCKCWNAIHDCCVGTGKCLKCLGVCVCGGAKMLKDCCDPDHLPHTTPPQVAQQRRREAERRQRQVVPPTVAALTNTTSSRNANPVDQQPAGTVYPSAPPQSAPAGMVVNPTLQFRSAPSPHTVIHIPPGAVGNPSGNNSPPPNYDAATDSDDHRTGLLQQKFG